MSCPHCRQEQRSTAPGLPAQRLRRGIRGTVRKTSWIVPGILLVIMPKCPICLAAYIALITGVSIPVAGAAWLRGTLIVVCVAALIWLIVRRSLYFYRRQFDHNKVN